ncbi:hypothetical protein AKJ09_06262 [Labilithrix luteola]|uniref:Uncharacterized protein n=1 Tax=Labilithrix luteola TaxID=1391654 RepID=A0A0K1Q1E3_9BACT|nr:hypothetical protein AKJ09_06262 [Labilithrix luteola]
MSRRWAASSPRSRRRVDGRSPAKRRPRMASRRVRSSHP